MDAEVEDVEAELWADWLGRRHGEAAGRACLSAAELAEAMAERNGSLLASGGHVWGVHSVRGDLWTPWELTGGAFDGVWPTGGRHAAAGELCPN